MFVSNSSWKLIDSTDTNNSDLNVDILETFIFYIYADDH
jgi:hypothetical protein